MDANVEFYEGRRTIRVDGRDYTIDKFQGLEFHNLQLLEYEHNYIQWLFPIDAFSKFNSMSCALTRREASQLVSNTTSMLRLLYSFAMMLNFYGFRLASVVPPSVCYANDETYVAARIENLRQCRHNWMRITRILRCICLFGMPGLAQSWLNCLEKIVPNHIPDAATSLYEFWFPALSLQEDWPTDNRALYMMRCCDTRADAVQGFLCRVAGASIPAGAFWLWRHIKQYSVMPKGVSHIVVGLLSTKHRFYLTPLKAKIMTICTQSLRRKSFSLASVEQMFIETRPEWRDAIPSSAQASADRILLGGVDKTSPRCGVDVYTCIRNSCIFVESSYVQTVWIRQLDA